MTAAEASEALGLPDLSRMKRPQDLWPLCPDCGMQGWHLERCKFYRSPEHLDHMRDLYTTIGLWEKYGYLSKYSAEFIRNAVADGQEFELYRRQPSGRPHIVWNDVHYTLSEFNGAVASVRQGMN